MLKLVEINNWYNTYGEVISNLTEDERIEIFNKYGDDQELSGGKSNDEIIDNFFYELTTDEELLYKIFSDHIDNVPVIGYLFCNELYNIKTYNLLEVNKLYMVSDIEAELVGDKYILVSVYHEGNACSSAWWDVELEEWVSFNNNIRPRSMVYIQDKGMFLSYYTGFVYIAGDYTILYTLKDDSFVESEVVLYKLDSSSCFINEIYKEIFNKELIENLEKISGYDYANNLTGMYVDWEKLIVYIYDKWDNFFRVDINILLND